MRVIRVICVGDPALSSVWVVEQLSPLMGWLSGRPVLWYLGAITSVSFERSLGRDGHRNRTLQPPRGVAWKSSLVTESQCRDVFVVVIAGVELLDIVVDGWLLAVDYFSGDYRGRA